MKLSGWFDRSRSVFGRKASRMQEAYVTGAVGVTALRDTLTELKLGRDPLKDLSTEPGQINSLCHVDPIDVLTTPDAEAKLWYRASLSFDLTDAPWGAVRFVKQSWWVPTSPLTTDHEPEEGKETLYEGWIISGMRLDSVDDSAPENVTGPNGQPPDENFFVTPYADLFYSTPPLSIRQTYAVDTLNHLATDEFWIAEAHKNGVYDDATVKAMAARTRKMIAKMLAPDKVPEMQEGDQINILGYQN